MKLFYLQRDIDESGVSGTGKVAEGVILHTGKCVLSWFGAVSSVAIYNNIEELEKIHGHAGKTKIVFEKELG